MAEGGVSFDQAGVVDGVTIGQGGLTISLTTGAVLATSLNGNFPLGPRITDPIKDVGRLVREYGGRAEDWAKISSRSYPVGDGTSIQAHAYRNVVTGQTVEIKSKLEWVKP